MDNTTLITLPNVDSIILDDLQFDIYNTFTSHIAEASISRMEMKILSSIHFTADFLGDSDALISNELVEMGLRAPRIAFPMEFLEYVDSVRLKDHGHILAPSRAIRSLCNIWLGLDLAQETLGQFRSLAHIIREDIMV